MRPLTDSRSKLWTAIVDLINLRQLEACMFKTWIEKVRAVKQVSKSKRVHVLADQLNAECTRIAQTQTWFEGQRLPRTTLVRSLISAHVVAVQSYDHDDAEDINDYLFELGHAYAMAGAQ